MVGLTRIDVATEKEEGRREIGTNGAFVHNTRAVNATHCSSLEMGLRCMKLQNPPLVHSLKEQSCI